MTDLPSGWEWRRLDEVADVRLGRQRSPKNHTGNQMRPYLRAANVDWNGLALQDVKEMNFTDEEMAVYRLEPGDIVLNEASGSASEVGKPALWNGEIEDCAFQNHLIRVRSLGPDARYLLHFFSHLAISGSFAKESRGVGIHHLGKTKLAAWLIPLPSLNEQRRVVNILEDHLSRLDAAVLGLHTVSSSAHSFVASFLQGLFAHHQGKYASTPLESVLMPHADGRLIHQGWSPRCDAVASQSGEVWAVLKTTAIQGGQYRQGENKVLPERLVPRASIEVQAGDLLMTRAGPRARCGVSCLVRSTRPRLMLSDKMYRMQPSGDHVDPRYLEMFLQSPQAMSRLEEMKTGISDSGVNLTQARLMTLMVPIPPLSDQAEAVRQFEENTSRSHAALAASAQAIVKSGLLRRSLLRAAFIGQLGETTCE